MLEAIGANLEARCDPLQRRGPTDEDLCPDPARWYVIECRPKQEECTLENLERQAYECYAAFRTVERLREGHRQPSSEPLFPGYLFIHLNRANDNWRPVRFTRGVNRIVTFNGDPPTVADEIIAGIRARVGAAPLTRHCQPGERVRITQGAFVGIEAIFVATQGEERIILSLEILQREQRLCFQASKR